MNAAEIKEKILTNLEIEHQAKERIFALVDVSKELVREIGNSSDALDHAFLGKSMGKNDTEEKLMSLTAERKELTATLNKTRREITHLREMLTLT
ncbi:hypothetical protein [Noviherbaspirillum sedimenti]|uniref:Uncharacterized protein n=1 Tax=Noviherbaspirillum sedimenti TaxID=2320865 RepID=A0A3A3FW07_9BURK|nr:hypothetical protein [Noviherbaspirillum sedimenti]RJG00337.1 hypothetical protein D3878_01060 [Noviherbaspirillum sedimenti]